MTLECEGDLLQIISYLLIENARLGIAEISETGLLTYIPNSNSSGNDQISIKVTDIHGLSSTSEIV